ncbi:uncharacterized protein PG998_015062 [Apiospora kogelbergensis]|uniref:uncharacterized protein n=1 Tax=Apiospora kogelbergensis TaxID=1337665 RepID=UPI0031311E1D
MRSMMEKPQIPAAAPFTTKASANVTKCSVNQNSRDRRSQCHHRNRPRHHANNRAVSGTQSATAYDQTSQSHSVSGMLSESNGVPASIPLTASALPAITPAHWPEGSVVENNGLGSQEGLAWSQDQSNLQYIPATEVDSNHWTNTTMDPISHTSNGHCESNQAQWYAIKEYLSSSPRNDAWSPLVMPVQERGVERDLEVKDSQVITDGGNEEESGQDGA